MTEAASKTAAKAKAAKPEPAPPRQAPVEESPPEPEVPAPADNLIPRERLLGPDAAAFTGYPPHVLAGALHGDDREALTPDEARAAAQAWLGE